MCLNAMCAGYSIVFCVLLFFTNQYKTILVSTVVFGNFIWELMRPKMCCFDPKHASDVPGSSLPLCLSRKIIDCSGRRAYRLLCSVYTPLLLHLRGISQARCDICPFSAFLKHFIACNRAYRLTGSVYAPLQSENHQLQRAEGHIACSALHMLPAGLDVSS